MDFFAAFLSGVFLTAVFLATLSSTCSLTPPESGGDHSQDCFHDMRCSPRQVGSGHEDFDIMQELCHTIADAGFVSDHNIDGKVIFRD
jgi:hypothetical protein